MKFHSKFPSIHFMLHSVLLVTLLGPIFITQYARKYELRRLITRGEGVRMRIAVWHSVEEIYGKFSLEEGVYRLLFTEDPKLQIGDEIEVVSSPSESLKLTNSYRIQLQVQSIRQIKRSENTLKLRIIFLINAIEMWRREIINGLYQTFSPHYADLLLGIVIGKDIASDSNIYKMLRQAGMLHVAVASGSNIVIIASIFSAVIKHFLRGRSLIITTVIIAIVYAYFTGFDPSIVRALIMFSTVHTGRVFGRVVSSNRSFFYTILLLLAFEPFLIYSASFLLSASATASLLWICPFFLKKEWFGSMDSKSSVRGILKESFFTSLSVTIFTIPLQMYLFDSVNIISLLSNVLLSLLVFPIMILGLVHMVLLSVHTHFLSVLIAPFTWLLLEVFVRIIKLLAVVPFGTIPIVSTSLRMVILYDFLLIIGVTWLSSRDAR